MLSVIYSDQFLLHKTGRFHPEKPERLTAIVAALQTTPWAAKIDWRSPTAPGPRLTEFLQQVHDPSYIEQLAHLARQGGGRLDPDTPVSPQSYDVALLAANAWLDGVDCVLQMGRPAFVLARPPGHHALRETGMGFCLFSNAAVAATYALAQPAVQRVAILDWDVHHGNGTQALVEHHPQIAYCSLHQSPCYPGTGAAIEQGSHHNVLNLPLPAQSTLSDYQPLFEQKILPFFTQFQPDLLIVSAGYDANADDPLADISLYPSDYGVFSRYCLQITSRIVFGLEGGYDLSSLAQSVLATLEPCLD